MLFMELNKPEIQNGIWHPKGKNILYTLKLLPPTVGLRQVFVKYYQNLR